MSLDGGTLATIANIAPKIIGRGYNNVRAKARFLMEIEKAVKEVKDINVGGLFTPHTVNEAAGIFVTVEGGAILAGTAPEYDITSIGLRGMWKSMNWTGSLERQLPKWITKFQRDGMSGTRLNDGKPPSDLIQKATNWAVGEVIYSTFKMWRRYQNYYVLQGVSNSAIATITGITSTGANGKLTFDPSTTSTGNRLFDKNASVQFYDGGGNARDAGAARKVNATVDHDDPTGTVQFDNVSVNVQVGDTAHFNTTFGLCPVGVPEHINDVGNFQGVARSTAPHLYQSVMIRHANAPSLSPMFLREQIQRVRGKVSDYNAPIKFVLWMNGCQKYNFETFIYNSLVRQVTADKVRVADFAVQEFEWDGHPLNTDIDVPPDSTYLLDMLSWDRVVQTRMRPLIYNTNDIIVNIPNANGGWDDSKQTTIVEESNWRCNNPIANSIASGYGFNPAFIS